MPQTRSCPIGRFAPARLALLALAAAIPAAPAGAQYQTGFEPPIYTGSPAGVIITGQDGWILPVAGSVDGLVQTYAGNVAGVRGRAPVGS